ncbi:hypothetical protein FGG08_002510 [Glutinoglossum americanum]|uniref:Uncharacterized protein n=1 Tax=Glutinoglossum americanum TaxID=1670608 RepID=A0A9P8L1L7_9PEZI|nr:hypothetical protein FGG08_002510 [Glutinoglossum americanum]
MVSGPWEQSQKAAHRLHEVLEEVIPSIGNTETAPTLPRVKDLIAEARNQGLEVIRQQNLCQEVLASQKNAAAVQKNAQAYKSSSPILPLTAQKYDEDGTPKWEHHPRFPKTLIQFKHLSREPETVKDLLDYYEVLIYRDGSSSEATDAMVDNPHCVQRSMQECLEELAVTFGMDLKKIGDLGPNILKDV